MSKTRSALPTLVLMFATFNLAGCGPAETEEALMEEARILKQTLCGSYNEEGGYAVCCDDSACWKCTGQRTCERGTGNGPL